MANIFVDAFFPKFEAEMFIKGAQYVADTAGACWLLDEIALAQRLAIPVKREDFQVWDIKVDAAQAGDTDMWRWQ